LVLKLDQKNLCLVCRELRDVGTPILYNEMVFSVKKIRSSFPQVIAATENHSGLPHVRTLRVAGKGWGELMDSNRYILLCQLLSAIPKDTLTSFR
jgi:hypothetical protein